MDITSTPISDLFIVNSPCFKDERGQFSRLFCSKELKHIIKNRHIVQINQSQTQKKGAVRGLHFQFSPMKEMKLVRCTQGKVFDVAIDLRAESKTFMQWHGEVLSAKNGKMMVIPEGFAHGFQVLEENSAMLYFHTECYSPEHEGGIYYKDKKINIDWPLACTDISEKDKSFSPLNAHFSGLL